MVLFLFLHRLFPHNAWIPESSYYSKNYAGIIASCLLSTCASLYKDVHQLVVDEVLSKQTMSYMVSSVNHPLNR